MLPEGITALASEAVKDRVRFPSTRSDAIGELCRFDAVAFPPPTQQVVTPPKQDMEEMAARMPHCRLTVVPGVGHSMIVERPEMYAQYFVEFFGGGKG